MLRCQDYRSPLVWEVAKDKEVDGLAAPSFSSIRALQLPKQREGWRELCLHLLPPEALWGSVELSIETQVTSAGAFGELRAKAMHAD